MSATSFSEEFNRFILQSSGGGLNDPLRINIKKPFWKSRKTMNCSSSSDPAAVNATLLYNFNDDEKNLWRRDQDVPLLACSSTDPPPDSQCTVCVDQVVYAVCRNLTEGVKLTMETVGHHIEISKSECPKLLSDDAPQWLLPVVIILILFFIATIIILGVYKCWNRSNYLRGTEIQTDKENRSSDLNDVIVMDTEL